MSDPKRYAIVGTGGRCRMFIDGICGPFKDHARLVGLCDLSATRMAHWNRHINGKFGHEPVLTFAAADFDRMVQQTKPDVVIVTTVDAYHHRYIIRAMELGCDAISEKPMTVDADKCSAIFDAIERTGRSLRVTFNYRYMPAITKVREIIASGAIGEPKLVDFQWRLDTSHGADYFRRWHREKDKSGGLLVHKSTHHFDLVNFWLSDYPQTVFAMGGLEFYGQKNAAKRGERYNYDRYTGMPGAKDDPFALSLDKGESKSLYLDAEADSGYIRDRNVFAGEDKWPITAEDTMTVMTRYRGGAILSYSLIAYCPWEGERIAITGTKGQVEYFSRGKGHIIRGQSDEELAAEQYVGEQYVRVQKMFGPPVNVPIPVIKGGHGGSDGAILERIFVPDLAPDPFQRDATHIDGAASILTGICANQSIATGLPVQVEDVFPLKHYTQQREPASV
ncbi:MAG: Gfo/Idh/MocA family oxidoreductase [Phycisphaeraceae bacterium]